MTETHYGRVAALPARKLIESIVCLPAWMKAGLCNQTDPELFHPDVGESNVEAKKICGRCPVMEQCREYAISRREPYGVWGGLSEAERRKLYPAVMVCVWCKTTFEDKGRARYCGQSCAQASATGGRSEEAA